MGRRGGQKESGRGGEVGRRVGEEERRKEGTFVERKE